MDAINSLPINAPVAPVPNPRGEPALEHDSQNSSFENLLDEKRTLSGESTALDIEAPRSEEPAENAYEADAPVDLDVSTLLAMFPLLPTLTILTTLPLQAEPIAPAASPEAAVGKTASAPVETASAVSTVSLPSTGAAEKSISPVVWPQSAIPSKDVSEEEDPALTAPAANTNAPSEAELPRTAPVITSGLRAMVVSAEETSPMAASAPVPAQGNATVTEVNQSSSGDVGMMDAMHTSVMIEPVKSRSLEPKTADISADPSSPELGNPQSDIRVIALGGQEHTAGEHREEEPGFQSQTNDAPAPNATPANSIVGPVVAADEPGAVSRTQTETIVHRTMDAVERIRVTDGERVEIEIKLDAGPALTVRLQVIRGEVKPTFLTDSHALRQAIEKSWSQFSERGGERSVRVTTPVFESPNSQSGMNDLNQQQREGRRRAFAEAWEEASAGRMPAGPNSSHGVGPALAAAAPSVGVRLYA